MPRHREFDTDEALDQMLQVFWKNGFERTSFSELERATGLKRASLFAAFGDKARLFARILERYHQQICTEFADTYAGMPSARRAVERWLRCQIGARRSNNQRGCLLVKTATGSGAHNHDCARLLRQHSAAMEKLLGSLLMRGKANKEFRRDLDVPVTCRFLLALTSGFHALEGATPPSARSSHKTEKMLRLIVRALM